MSLMGNEIVQDDLSNKLTDLLPACGIAIPKGEVAVVVVKDWISDADGLRLEIRISVDESDALDILGMFKSFAETRALAAQAATKRQVSL